MAGGSLVSKRLVHPAKSQQCTVIVPQRPVLGHPATPLLWLLWLLGRLRSNSDSALPRLLRTTTFTFSTWIWLESLLFFLPGSSQGGGNTYKSLLYSYEYLANLFLRLIYLEEEVSVSRSKPLEEKIANVTDKKNQIPWHHFPAPSPRRQDKDQKQSN